ncbi:LPXTG cell wall anchor domain-containing protein [Streptomyces sp. NPDC046759]|uniref:LPXTG cell wall anchor domain-containing protein n=1 Tax=Streptomyces sp. NPDC046759 TaxID=3155019 RepID=UPI0033D1C997
MRLCTPLSPCVAAAAAASASALVVVPVGPADALEDPPPACVGADARAFPLATRIRGGPDSYEAGGGYGTWYIDLTNTTNRTCTGVHPVIVLVDDKRALRPDQPQLEFYDGPTARRVTFQGTDEQELIGVLDAAGFAGFAVPPGRTVSIKVRLELPSGAPSEQVTANAAVVQRRGDDGEWIGESNAYRFGISHDGDEPTPDPDRTQEGGDVRPSPSGSAQATPGTGTASPAPDPEPPFAVEAGMAAERDRELARTGTDLARGLLVAGATLLVVGGAALLLARRRR